jgi:hypothetical protein
MCPATTFLANWNGMAIGMLTLNVSSQVCVPKDCVDLANDNILQGTFAGITASTCVNATNIGLCDPAVRCTAYNPPLTDLQRAELDINLSAATLAFIILIFIIVIVAFVFIGFLKK